MYSQIKWKRSHIQPPLFMLSEDCSMDKHKSRLYYCCEIFSDRPDLRDENSLLTMSESVCSACGLSVWTFSCAKIRFRLICQLFMDLAYCSPHREHTKCMPLPITCSPVTVPGMNNRYASPYKTNKTKTIHINALCGLIDSSHVCACVMRAQCYPRTHDDIFASGSKPVKTHKTDKKGERPEQIVNVMQFNAMDSNCEILDRKRHRRTLAGGMSPAKSQCDNGGCRWACTLYTAKTCASSGNVSSSLSSSLVRFVCFFPYHTFSCCYCCCFIPRFSSSPIHIYRFVTVLY